MYILIWTLTVALQLVQCNQLEPLHKMENSSLINYEYEYRRLTICGCKIHFLINKTATALTTIDNGELGYLCRLSSSTTACSDTESADLNTTTFLKPGGSPSIMTTQVGGTGTTSAGGTGTTSAGGTGTSDGGNGTSAGGTGTSPGGNGTSPGVNGTSAGGSGTTSSGGTGSTSTGGTGSTSTGGTGTTLAGGSGTTSTGGAGTTSTGGTGTTSTGGTGTTTTPSNTTTATTTTTTPTTTTTTTTTTASGEMTLFLSRLSSLRTGDITAICTAEGGTPGIITNVNQLTKLKENFFTNAFWLPLTKQSGSQVYNWDTDNSLQTGIINNVDHNAGDNDDGCPMMNSDFTKYNFAKCADYSSVKMRVLCFGAPEAPGLYFLTQKLLSASDVPKGNQCIAEGAQGVKVTDSDLTVLKNSFWEKGAYLGLQKQGSDFEWTGDTTIQLHDGGFADWEDKTESGSDWMYVLNKDFSKVQIWDGAGTDKKSALCQKPKDDFS